MAGGLDGFSSSAPALKLSEELPEPRRMWPSELSSSALAACFARVGVRTLSGLPACLFAGCL